MVHVIIGHLRPQADLDQAGPAPQGRQPNGGCSLLRNRDRSREFHVLEARRGSGTRKSHGNLPPSLPSRAPPGEAVPCARCDRPGKGRFAGKARHRPPTPRPGNKHASGAARNLCKGGPHGWLDLSVGGSPKRPVTTSAVAGWVERSRSSRIRTPSSGWIGMMPCRIRESTRPNRSPIPTPDQTDHSSARQRQRGCRPLKLLRERCQPLVGEGVIGLAAESRTRDNRAEGDRGAAAGSGLKPPACSASLGFSAPEFFGLPPRPTR